MQEKYFTVEQISEMLSIHPKTIQRYIREGKLRASKIGKSWRVTGHDLSIFTESVKNTGVLEDQRASADRVKVSSVIDIEVYDKEDAIRIINTLTAALNAKPPEYGRSSMQTQYIESESMVRVTLWGGIRLMEVLIGSICALTEPNKEER